MTSPREPSPQVGRSIARIDGPLKVSGRAKYTADFNFPGMLYAVPVPATVAAGRVKSIDVASATASPGVRAVYHHGNFQRFYRIVPPTLSAIVYESRPPFDDDVVRYYGEHIAVVVADTLQQARAAACLVAVTYEVEPHDVGPLAPSSGGQKIDYERGDPDRALAAAAVSIDQTYETSEEVHNPIEAHATIAVWEGDNVTLYETVQAVMNQRQAMSQMLGIPPENVKVVTRFLGSGFGGKIAPWTHCLLAAESARRLARPVKLVVDRRAMFSTVGHRPRTRQRVRLSATEDGKLTSVQHDFISSTSMRDDYKENCGEATPSLYSTANLRVTSEVVRRNKGAPCSYRGPGAVPGLYALEAAMDELAVKLGIDPVELRLRNEPELDEQYDIPFTSRHLPQCLAVGAACFGWEKRDARIGSMRRDGQVLGWGVAAASWVGARWDCEVEVELRDDGTVRVKCGAQDIGTGSYTMFAQVTADAVGLPLERVDVVIGDSTLPPGALSGGSMLTASIIDPIQKAVAEAGRRLLEIAAAPGGVYDGQELTDLTFEAGHVRLKSSAAKGIGFGAVLKSSRVGLVSGRGQGAGNFLEATGRVRPHVSTQSFGCQFVEVTWRPEIARLRVSRIVTVVDAGRIINPLTARNQIHGAVVMGIGMALFEKMIFDEASGAPINSNLADYIVATHADAPPDHDVEFLEYPDYSLNALGAKGIGEIGLAGVAPAITSAIYHATGKRVRRLPVHIEDLL